MKLLWRIESYLASLLSGWNSVNRKLPQHKNSCTLGILCFTLLAGYYPSVSVFSPSSKTWCNAVDHYDVTEFVSHWKLATKIPVIFFHEWNIKYRGIFYKQENKNEEQI